MCCRRHAGAAETLSLLGLLELQGVDGVAGRHPILATAAAQAKAM
jgi:hypothetical protein